jgi:hypothetical protein
MRPGFRRSSVTRVGSFLRGTLQDLGVQERILEQQALAKWREVVGPQIAASSRPDGIRERVLFVTCKSSMWSNELSLHKPDIVKRLNAAVGKKIIDDIRFSARGFRKAEPAAKTEKPDPAVDSVPLSGDEVGAVEEVAAICESEELAAKVRRAMLTSKRMRLLRAKEGDSDG